MNTTVTQPTDQAQRDQAVDPTKSFIVQAPAGSGKTTLLVERYLRLLTVVARPEEILAITFTRKAANEMKSRILAKLQVPEHEQSDTVKKVLARDQSLNWQLTLNPQRMKVQTIDSFNHMLVRQLPYRSKLSLEYETTTDMDQFFNDAINQTLSFLGDSNEGVSGDVATTLGMVDNERMKFSELLIEMLKTREQWLPQLLPVIQAGNDEEIVKEFEQARIQYCDALKYAVQETLGDILYAKLIYLTKVTIDNILIETDQEIPEYNNMLAASDWNRLYYTIFTKGDEYRKLKGLNKSNGFPVGSDELKRQMDEAITDVKELGDHAKHQLQRIRNLPEDNLTPTERQAILSYAKTVLLASNELFEVFKQKRKTDHTEVSIAAHRALQEENSPTELALALDYRIKHLLIDEYQDTSIAQNKMINLLMAGWEPDDGNTFFAVGDPMQSIYTFRDADVTNFLMADSGGIAHRNPQKINLTSNFRSTDTLVDFFNQVFPSVLGEVNSKERGLVAYSPVEKVGKSGEPQHKAQLTLCQTSSTETEPREIAKKLRELVDEDPESSKAILVRTRTHSQDLFPHLREQNLTWSGVEITSLANLGVVRDLHSLATALCNREDRLAWAALLLSPLVGIPTRDLETLIAVDEGIQVILNPIDTTSSISDETVDILNRIRQPLLNAMRSQHQTLRTRVERAWYELGGLYGYANSDYSNFDIVLSNAQHYLDLLESMPGSLPNLDELWEKVEQNYATEVNPDADVEIMTIHKAKGLEFDHVILPRLKKQTRADSPDLVQLRPMGNKIVAAIKSLVSEDPLHDILFAEVKEKRLNEVARLLYVASTRAIKSLWLYATVSDLEKEKPGKRTFLGLLIEKFPESMKVLVTDYDSQETETTKSKVQHRIDPAFRFRPPVLLSPLPTGDLIHSEDEVTEFNPLDLSNAVSSHPNKQVDLRIRDLNDIVAVELDYSESLVVGQLVHQAFQRAVELRTLEHPSEAQVARWRNQLRGKSFTVNQIASILEVIQDQITSAINDPMGQWLLNPDHQESAVEQSFVFPVGAETKTAVVDRTFIDEKGTRWVVDYKTSRIPDDENLDLDLRAMQYQAQLLLYAKILQHDDKRPVRAAIYFTDRSQFVEVDVSEPMQESLGLANGSIAEYWAHYRAESQRLRD